MRDMTEAKLTQEFSICLLPDIQTTERVTSLRRELPPSPYRDDLPHLTLLRGITSDLPLSDETLLADMDAQLDLPSALPLAATVQAVENKSNRFYSDSSLLLLDPSAALLACRRQIVRRLTSTAGYAVEPAEQTSFTPYVTVRLGVPLYGDMLQKTEELFLRRSITFNSWLLVRLLLRGDERYFKAVYPLA